MNEQPNSVPASPAPDIPTLAPDADAPVSVNPAAPAPFDPAGVHPVTANPAPNAVTTPAPFDPLAAPAPFDPFSVHPANASDAVSPAPTPPNAVTTPAPGPVEPDYRAMYENLRRENEILRQNAETARRSPVQSVSGGGAVTVPNDAFLRGFDSDTW